MARQTHHRKITPAPAVSTYGEGTTYPDKQRPGRWLAKFPLGHGQSKTRRFISEQAADSWREEMKRQRDDHRIDIATAQTPFEQYALLEECIRRDALRSHPVGEECIREMAEPPSRI